jgi:hypothetical protein
MSVLTVCTLFAGIVTAVLSRLGTRLAWFTEEQAVFFNFTSALLVVTAAAFFLLALWYRNVQKNTP